MNKLYYTDPIMDDLIDGWAGRLGFVQSIDDDEIIIDVNGGDWRCPKFQKNSNPITYEIIQRNNKPFFMPEIESE